MIQSMMTSFLSIMTSSYLHNDVIITIDVPDFIYGGYFLMPFRQTVFPATVFRINIFVDNDLQYTARLELLLIDCDGLMKLS